MQYDMIVIRKKAVKSDDGIERAIAMNAGAEELDAVVERVVDTDYCRCCWSTRSS
jgi:hypothetical protein